MEKLNQLMRLLACVLMILAVAVNRDRKMFGHELGGGPQNADEAPTWKSGGTTVISTKEIAKDIKGYGGSTPLEISLREGRVTGIEALPNAETPEFFGMVMQSGMLDAWTGMTVEEARSADVDGVSGATFSSEAVIATVRRGLEYAAVQEGAAAAGAASPADIRKMWRSPKFLCTLLVAVMGCLLPLFVRSRRYRVVQLVLNVVVLGLWSGSFLSYSLLVNYMANGVNLLAAVVPLLLLTAAFIFPLFGRKGHYCAWICPLGSLQELAGKCVKRKWRMTPRVLHALDLFRDGLWAVLMLLMWCGVFFRWMDYELFTAFLFRQAAPAVIGIAVGFILLSCVVQRPYCRFVCPTGNLLRISQNT